MADSGSSLVDPYGFERPADFDIKRHEEFMSRYLRVLARRAKRWATLMKGKSDVEKSSKLKRFIRKGVPLEYRPMIWMNVSDAAKRMQKQPTLYIQILEGSHDSNLLDLIQTDIPRTFPNNIYFRDRSKDPQTKRSSLYKILVAVAHKNQRVGYCQGMNFVAGLLLLIVKDESRVFWLMDTLLNYILPDYYTADMVGLKVDCEVLGQLVRLKFPEVYRVTEHCGGSVWSIIATRWFICLFVDVVPTETVLRIWDCLFYEGTTILFQVGLTLISNNVDAIVKCQSVTEVMDVFREISSGAFVADCHKFMQCVFESTSSINESMITQLRRECQSSLASH